MYFTDTVRKRQQVTDFTLNIAWIQVQGSCRSVIQMFRHYRLSVYKHRPTIINHAKPKMFIFESAFTNKSVIDKAVAKEMSRDRLVNNEH